MCCYVSTAGDDEPTPLPALAASSAPFAVARLALFGIRGPVRPCIGALRGLADADNHVFAVLMPTGSAATDDARAALVATAINAGLGIAGQPAAEAKAA